MLYFFRMKKKVSLLVISCLILTIFGCQKAEPEPDEKPEEQELIKYENLAIDAGFDTIYSYSEFGYDRDEMAKNFDTGVALFTHYNNLFDIYNDYDNLNNLKTINDNAGIEPVVVDEDIIDMLEEAKYFYDISGGVFDVTIGSLLQVWHRYREDGMAKNEKDELGDIPTQEELEEAAGCKGWDKVIIDKDKSTVYITDPCVSLDVGGIAKGYAAEKIAEEILKTDIVYGSVNAGRNIRTLRVKPNGVSWRIGVVTPDGDSSILVIQSFTENSFVTSGDSERFYTASDGNRYHHIINPNTLYPSDYYRSVSIVTKNSGAADALSTALYSLSIEEGKELLKKYSEDTGETAYAVWITEKEKSQGQAGKEVDGFWIVYSEELEDLILWH